MKKDPSRVKFCAAPIGGKLKAAICLAQYQLTAGISLPFL